MSRSMARELDESREWCERWQDFKPSANLFGQFGMSGWMIYVPAAALCSGLVVGR